MHLDGSQMKKQLPVGTSDYKDLRDRNFYYVDKTLLIKDINESGQVVLVPRPCRFGKTLNLSMLRYFYEINTDQTESLFFDTHIWKLSEYRERQGTFPVIFLSFREIVQPSLPRMMKKFATVISKEFKRHQVLLQGDTLDSDEKETFRSLSVRRASEEDLGGSLEFLIRMLYKYHKKKVIVLIDEYDVPAQTAWIYGFYDELIPFSRSYSLALSKIRHCSKKG
jgi:Predicted AAA-ATPase